MVVDLDLIWVYLNSMLVCFNFGCWALALVYVVNLALVLVHCGFCVLIVWLAIVSFLCYAFVGCFAGSVCGCDFGRAGVAL